MSSATTRLALRAHDGLVAVRAPPWAGAGCCRQFAPSISMHERRTALNKSHTAAINPGTGLRLADHVRVCLVGDQVVLLDLLQGRYLGVGGKPAGLLSGAIDGWPAADAACSAPASGVEVAGLARSLLAQGLLSHGAPEGAPAIDIEEPARSIDVQDAVAAARTGMRDLCRFLQAAAVAGLWLRRRSMHTIAGTVAARRLRSGRTTHEMDMQRLHGAIATYDKLRPLVFTARDKCLFDSLALMNFLAGEQLFPRWVIGVRTGPFRAHSWVQSGDCVLNDEHENVRRFKPILIV